MADPQTRTRDLLANERTFLAWARTGAALMGLGVAIAKFGGQGAQAIAAGTILVVVGALRARYEERALEWVPYFHRWLGDGVASPDRIGYLWAGASTSTTRSSAPSR